MILQVHDELNFNAFPEELQLLCDIVKNEWNMPVNCGFL